MSNSQFCYKQLLKGFVEGTVPRPTVLTVTGVDTRSPGPSSGNRPAGHSLRDQAKTTRC
jgi:hypothetical protein